jgi:hypothetical protein
LPATHHTVCELVRKNCLLVSTGTSFQTAIWYLNLHQNSTSIVPHISHSKLNLAKLHFRGEKENSTRSFLWFSVSRCITKNHFYRKDQMTDVNLPSGQIIARQDKRPLLGSSDRSSVLTAHHPHVTPTQTRLLDHCGLWTIYQARCPALSPIRRQRNDHAMRSRPLAE